MATLKRPRAERLQIMLDRKGWGAALHSAGISE